MLVTNPLGRRSWAPELIAPLSGGWSMLLFSGLASMRRHRSNSGWS
jgi:hypothetical protein